MITIEEAGNLISVAVFGEFTLADYQEFEEHGAPQIPSRWFTSMCYSIGGIC